MTLQTWQYTQFVVKYWKSGHWRFAILEEYADANTAHARQSELMDAGMACWVYYPMM